MPLFKKKSVDKKHSTTAAPQHHHQHTSVNPAQPATSRPPPYPTQRRPVETGTSLPNGGAIAQLRNEKPSAPASKPGQAAHLRREFSDEDSTCGDLGTGAKQLVKTELETKSRLCRTLPEVLHDNGALPYFIQFMQAQGAAHLVQFWLATESFSTASWSRLRSESLTNASRSLGGQKPRSASGLSANEASDAAIRPAAEGLSPTAERLEGVTATTTTPTATDQSSNGQRTEARGPASPASNGLAVKTHSRAKSDSVVGIDRAPLEGAAGTEPGHRRTNSWKSVDPRTAVERDASNIFTRYLCKDAPLPVGITDEIRLEVIAKMCPQEGWLNPDCFKSTQNFVFETMETHFFQLFLRSEFHCKYQIDILTTGKAYLADILYNDTATFYFMEYMEQEGAVHLLQFWLAAENFQKHLLSQQGQYDSGEAQSDAMVLYDQYFSLQATCPIGFEDGVRLEMETNICREGGPLPDCFATPMRKAYTTLETVYFPGFLQSELYYKFLSELINTIKSEHPSESATAGPGLAGVSGGGSGVGGEKSEDKPKSRNTLLAEGNVKKLFEESEMNIESLDSNPDLLWQRPGPGMMTFGKVNHLGQFVAEYEPDPEAINKKSSGSKFSLKKLVKGEQDASKEEMALKIAQMIINDVNMQTGSSTPPPSPAIRAPASNSSPARQQQQPVGASPGRRPAPQGSPRVKVNPKPSSLSSS